MSIKSRILGADWKKWLKVHHAADWIITIILFIVSGAMGLFIQPRLRYLPEHSDAIQYPIEKDIVPTWLLMVLTLALPIIAFGLTQIWHHSRHDFHHATLGVLTAFAFTNFITTCIKLSVGRYRPNYAGVSTNWDGRQSFPSGHSSLAFSSMVFLSLYVAGKLMIYRSHTGSLVAKGIIVVTPIALAMFIAISRVVDYHHDFSDIIAGSLIGAGIGLMAYFMWYPSLFSKRPDLPRIHPAGDASDFTPKSELLDVKDPEQQC